MLLNSSTRATKLQYSQHEYGIEVALRVDENGTCTRREWHFGWAKVALAHQKTTFLWFSRRTARAKRCCLLCFFLQNGCSGRGCLNNICIASYGVGAKFFTTNLMSVDLPQNTPKTRKPIAERTSHGWLGCAVLPQNSQNTQNLAAWVWQGCHTLLICEHPCSSVGGSSLPEGSVHSVRSVGEHRSLVGAAETAAPTEWLRQEQKVAAWYGQGCPYLLLFTLLLFYSFTFSK